MHIEEPLFLKDGIYTFVLELPGDEAERMARKIEGLAVARFGGFEASEWADDPDGSGFVSISFRAGSRAEAEAFVNEDVLGSMG